MYCVCRLVQLQCPPPGCAQLAVPHAITSSLAKGNGQLYLALHSHVLNVGRNFTFYVAGSSLQISLKQKSSLIYYRDMPALKSHTTKRHGGVRVRLHPLLTFVLNKHERCVSRRDRFAPKVGAPGTH
jgi:hypothetical protein